MQGTSRIGRLLVFALDFAGRLSTGARERSLYEVLGQPPDADADSIKAAYRALARRFHPDVNADATASWSERLAEVNHAYATLSNPDTRAAYDRDLARHGVEARQRYAAFAAVSLATFAVTAGLVSLALSHHLGASQAPEAVHATNAVGDAGHGRLPGAAALGDDAGAGELARGVIWKTYRDPRFDFALRYPAGVFTLDAARSAAHLRTFVSRDGQALLRIVAAENTSGMSLAALRRSLMKERYAGAAFDPAPTRQHWFALSGTRGGEVFLERITYSCDGRSMHGWQMLYPAAQRATYDDLAKAVLLNHPHGNGPASACDDERGKAQAKTPARQKRG